MYKSILWDELRKAVKESEAAVRKMVEATKEATKNAVDHPSHYNVGGIEVIDAIEAWELNFSRGNAVKYIARAGHKSDELEDLRKAAWYIQREIERLEKLRGECAGM